MTSEITESYESTTILNYISNRLDSQIQWYSKKASHNKFRYKLTQTMIIFISALIPLMNIIFVEYYYITPLISSILGVMLLVILGITLLERYQETWILYSTNAEQLKKEKNFYQNEVGEYYNLDESQKNKLLVERVEFILLPETSKYSTIPQQQMSTTSK